MSQRFTENKWIIYKVHVTIYPAFIQTAVIEKKKTGKSFAEHNFHNDSWYSMGNNQPKLWKTKESFIFFLIMYNSFQSSQQIFSKNYHRYVSTPHWQHSTTEEQSLFADVCSITIPKHSTHAMFYTVVWLTTVQTSDIWVLAKYFLQFWYSHAYSTYMIFQY